MRGGSFRRETLRAMVLRVGGALRAALWASASNARVGLRPTGRVGPTNHGQANPRLARASYPPVPRSQFGPPPPSPPPPSRAVCRM